MTLNINGSFSSHLRRQGSLAGEHLSEHLFILRLRKYKPSWCLPLQAPSATQMPRQKQKATPISQQPHAQGVQLQQCHKENWDNLGSTGQAGFQPLCGCAESSVSAEEVPPSAKEQNQRLGRQRPS